MKEKATVIVTSTLGYQRGMRILVGDEMMRIRRVRGAHALEVGRLRWWHQAWRWAYRVLDGIWRWMTQW
jgi:hypothetical protein